MRRHWDKPVSFLHFWSPNRTRKKCMEATIAVISRPSLCCLSFVSWRPMMRMFNQRMFSHCSTNTSPISNKFKSGQFNGCLHACLHENILASENPEKRRAFSSAFSSKIWYSRVICVFLRWGLTYIWHVLWRKLSFNSPYLCMPVHFGGYYECIWWLTQCIWCISQCKPNSVVTAAWFTFATLQMTYKG